MFDIFFSPTKAFSRLKEKPRWLVPLVIVVVASVAAAMVTTRFVDWKEQRNKAVERMRERNMSEEDIAKATEGMERLFSSPLVRYGGPFVNSLLVTSIGLVVLALIYNVMVPLLGGTSSFSHSLAVVTNAALVTVPGLLLRIVLSLLTRSAEATTSLAALFPHLKNGFLMVILSRLDPFAIWQLFLAGLGLSVVFQLKGSKSYWLVFSVWAVVTLIFAFLGGRAMR
ncbi:MAG: YIP1 family protein [candidate division WOR-3 bacterium]